MRTLICLAALSLGLAACAPAAPPAQAGAGTAPARPAQAGLCVACHGINGISTLPGHPHLAGQDEAYLRQALQQYRDGTRPSAPMRAAVGALSPADLDALARYYASLPRDGGASAP